MRRTGILALVGMLLLMGAIIWSSFNTPRVECEACITYDGRTNCASAAGPTRDEAILAATDVACAALASGRAGSLACGRSIPTRVTCPE
ncbi:MAG: hypothetical protein E2P03_00590 [Acidobacteria bacterium]|nr:MAG: hypothetical protein E2P03_00590 [Acidobacteriota bacterium]